MSTSVSRSFLLPEATFEHSGLRRRLLTHARYHTPALDRFMLDPDAFCTLHGWQHLKHDRTATIGLTSFDGSPVVVKRYNTRSPLHVIKRALRISRAEHCWRNAHRLAEIGVATAKPIAAIEERLGPVRRRAWYLAEHVDGILLSDWFANRDSIDEEDVPIVDQIIQTFTAMRDASIAHGDTKATNWIVSNAQVYLIDLDAMRRYRNSTLHQRRFARDIARFLRNFDQQPTLRSMFAERLEPLTTVSG